MRERTALPAAAAGPSPRPASCSSPPGMSNASIDVAAARARGITVCGTGGRPGAGRGADLGADPRRSCASVPEADRGLRAGGLAGRAPGRRARRQHARASRSRPARPAGRAGRARLRDGGARLVAEPRPRRWPAASGVEPCTKDDLLRRSDVVSLHLRLSDRTRGILGADELALMKPTAVLVNTSRGPLVDERALVAALERGTHRRRRARRVRRGAAPARPPAPTTPDTVLTPAPRLRHRADLSRCSSTTCSRTSGRGSTGVRCASSSPDRSADRLCIAQT